MTISEVERGAMAIEQTDIEGCCTRMERDVWATWADGDTGIIGYSDSAGGQFDCSSETRKDFRKDF